MNADTDISALVRRQRAYFFSGATRPLVFRQTQLNRLLTAIETSESSLLDALQADLRKSPLQAYTTEIGLVLSEARYVLHRLPKWLKGRRVSTPPVVWPARGRIQPEPRGVALIIGPWNYPAQLVLMPLLGAIAAGNCAVIKPSEFAPRTAAAVAQLIESIYPREFVAVVQGERDAAEALLRERFDSIFFTGGTNAGRAVMAAAARHLTPVTLELGGKCPCLVCADAPLETTARRIAWGKFMNAGQTCVAPDFVLADRRIHTALVAALTRAITGFYGPDPQQSPEYGRIINRKHLDRLLGYLGAGRIAFGGRHDAQDLYLAPTILLDPPGDAPVMQEEIFGPILPVLPFDSLDQAIQSLRDRPVPLALYLFTRDRASQDAVLSATRSGGVCLNDTVTHMISRNLPFGGCGDSGMGAYHGQATFDCFTHWRPVLKRALAPDPALRYPPPRLSLATMKRAYRFLLGA